MSTLSESTELLKEVRRAFPDDRPPTPEDLVADSSDEYGEYASIRQRFGGRQRAEISVDELVNDPDCIFFLSPKGHKHLLPCFLRAVLSHQQGLGALAERVVSSFIPRKSSFRDKLREAAAASTYAPPEVLGELSASIAQAIPATHDRMELLNREERVATAHVFDWIKRAAPEIDEQFDLGLLIDLLMAETKEDALPGR